MKNWFVSMVSAAALLAPLTAFGDVISPDEEACSARSPGQACILPGGGAGVCASMSVPVGNPANDARRDRVACQMGTATSDAGTPAADSGTTPPASSGCSVASPGRESRGSLAALCALALGAVAVQSRRARRGKRGAR